MVDDQGVRHLDESLQSGDAGPGGSAVEEAGGGRLVRLLPEVTEVLLQAVGRGQGRVEVHGHREALGLWAQLMGILRRWRIPRDS